MPTIPDMSEFEGKSQAGDLRFVEGELAREVALLGLSREEFCAKADISDKTLARAIRGQRIQSKTWGKILIALGARPGQLVKSA